MCVKRKNSLVNIHVTSLAEVLGENSHQEFEISFVKDKEETLIEITRDIMKQNIFQFFI